MKKNDVFTFTAPNGVEVTAVVVYVWHQDSEEVLYECYAQNRLFMYSEHLITRCIDAQPDEWWEGKYEGIIADYAILPDYDRMLEDYQHQIDMANDYADREY